MRPGWWLVLLLGCIEEVPREADDDGADSAGGSVEGADGSAADPSAPATSDPPDAAAPASEAGFACARVMPNRLELEALVGRAHTRAVMIESCGNQPIEITRISLTGDPAYVLVDAGPFALPPARADEAPPVRAIEITFTPEDTVAYGTTLVIEHTGGAPIEVVVVGRGLLNACPVAAVGRAEHFVVPLDIVELDGHPALDPDGPDERPAEYHWTVVERPPGSTALPVERYQNPRNPSDSWVADDPTTPTALFFVDLAGRYVIELTVEDNLSAVAPSDDCPQAPARVTIEAWPNEDIHIQLVWDTPADPDQTDDNGADMDLHLLHPTALNWAQAPLDCYYANASPDWGPPGPASDPSLDIDDVNGAGPENTNLDGPEDTAALGGLYRVGVDYYRAENYSTGGHWGPSEATVRIFLGGVQAGEWRRVLDRTHDFWEVAAIVWTADDRRVQVIDRYHGNPDPP